MTDTTHRGPAPAGPVPVAFSHLTTEVPREQERTDDGPAARDVEFTAPSATPAAGRLR